MTHLRQQIRDDMVAAVTGLPTTGANVFRSRVYPMAATNLPGLTVYTTSEQSSAITMGFPRTQERRLEVVVEAYVRAVANFDDAADEIVAEVEIAVNADLSRGGIAKDTQLTGVRMQMAADAEQPTCVAIMTFEVKYITKEDNPRGEQ
jgi:hypothetical protein